MTAHPSPVPPHDDEELVAAMARGDERAAALLYDRHGAVVFGLALRMLSDRADAEEITLETFAQAWRDAARFDRGRGAVVAWLTTIARSRALDHVRARKRRERATETSSRVLDTPTAMGQGYKETERVLEERERASAVVSALDELPEPQRRVIELAFFEGLTHPEVAERVREPLGTVKTRIRLGLRKLRDRLESLAPERSL